jgi:arsenate reductase
MKKKTVLFICTHNSARSQMAEGFLNHFYGDRFEAHSAGTEPSQVHPLAVKTMREVGIDISHHASKSAEVFINQEIDHVITVCDKAKQTCPFFPGGKKISHHSLEDPSQAEGTDEEKLGVFRRIRDEIRDWIDKTFGNSG